MPSNHPYPDRPSWVQFLCPAPKRHLQRLIRQYSLRTGLDVGGGEGSPLTALRPLGFRSTTIDISKEYLDSIGICICWLVMHIDGCQSVLSIAKQVKKSDRGAGATVSPVQMGRNGRDRRI